MSVRVQNPAPAFRRQALVDGEFRDLALEDYRGRWLLLVFYPLDFTFVCPTELLAFSDRVDEFRRLGADVVGVSVDSLYAHLAWTETPRARGGIQGIRIPLIADLDKSMSRDYDVLLEEGVSLRGLFLIDRDGIVRHVTVNDLPIGRSVDEALRVLQAAQFVAEHGEVCPADWRAGDKTIVPEPTASRRYFEGAEVG